MQKELLDLYGCYELKLDAISQPLKYLLESGQPEGDECN